MRLRDCNPDFYDQFVFHDPSTGLRGVPTTAGGVLFIVENRKGQELGIRRFDMVTGRYLEQVIVDFQRHQNNLVYQGSLVQKLEANYQAVLERKGSQ